MPDTHNNTNSQEAASGEYEVMEQSPELVRRMIEFFYTGDYQDWGDQPSQVPGEKQKKNHENRDNDSEENTVTALCLHAKMFALADMYQVDRLQSMAVAKYGKELERGASMQDVLDSIPDVYQLTPSTVRALRDRAIIAVRTGVRKPTQRLFETSGDQSRNEVAADTLLGNWDGIVAESPDFLKDLLSSYLRTPLLGRCSNCVGEQSQPVEPLQMKCLTCGKGGARMLQ